jgi:hypothetical protein
MTVFHRAHHQQPTSPGTTLLGKVGETTTMIAVIVDLHPREMIGLRVLAVPAVLVLRKTRTFPPTRMPQSVPDPHQETTACDVTIDRLVEDVTMDRGTRTTGRI